MTLTEIGMHLKLSTSLDISSEYFCSITKLGIENNANIIKFKTYLPCAMAALLRSLLPPSG